MLTLLRHSFVVVALVLSPVLAVDDPPKDTFHWPESGK